MQSLPPLPRSDIHSVIPFAKASGLNPMGKPLAANCGDKCPGSGSGRYAPGVQAS